MSPVKPNIDAREQRKCVSACTRACCVDGIHSSLRRDALRDLLMQKKATFVREEEEAMAKKRVNSRTQHP
jgi:hypothetical protein